MQFVPDIELYKLCRVSKLFQKLATDHLLWIYIFFHRNSLKIENNILCRRSRLELVQANIIKGPAPHVLIQKIENGEYIGGRMMGSAYDISSSLQNIRNRRKLRDLLAYRPLYEELCEKNLIPTRNTSIASNLVPKVTELEKKFQKNRVKRLLSERKSMEDLRNQGIVDSPKAMSLSLVPIQKQLSQGLIRRDLFMKMQHRIDVHTLDQKKLIPENFTAPMICPSIRPKIQFYERHV
jgi:hypothetical protein